MENSCAVPLRIVDVVAKLCCHSPKTPSAYQINCLTTFLEAFLLYDKIVIYPIKPPWGPFESLTHLVVNNSEFFTPLLQDFVQNEQEYLIFIDPFEKLSTKARSDIFDGMTGGYTATNGKNITYTNASDYFVDMLAKTAPENTTLEKMVRESLKIYGNPDELNQFSEKEKNRFMMGYASQRIWQLNIMRHVREEQKSIGAFVMPHWEPFWQHERSVIKNSLHDKFKDAESEILSTHLGTDYKIDVSPLMIVALDRTRHRVNFLETIITMRREFSDLRKVGSAYLSSLETAKTYNDISNIIGDWSQAWNLVLTRIKSHSVSYPLLSRIFMWDIVKELTPQSFFLSTLKVAAQEIQSLTVARKLSVINRLENDFLKARRIEKRINSLFKD